MSTEVPATPLQLRALLVRSRVSYRQLSRAVVLHRGTPMASRVSHPSLQRLAVSGRFPDHVDPAVLVAAINAVLAEIGIPAEEIQAAWQPEALATPPAPLDPNPFEHAAAHAWQLSSGPSHFRDPENQMLSEDARRTFGITRTPFGEPASQEDVWVGPDHRYVREAMYQTAKHGGFTAIVGASGSGKSTLRCSLLDRIRTTRDPIVVVQPEMPDKGALRAQHISEALVADLSTDRPMSSREALARQIRQLLIQRTQSGTRCCLLIEEAHRLHAETLLHLKSFSEIQDGFAKLLAIVIVGEPDLVLNLSERRNPKMRGVAQRVEICTLRPLDDQVGEYLEFKFKRVGLDATKILEPDAYAAIRSRLTYTGGKDQAPTSDVYPLRVHQLVAGAMNLAAQTGLPRVTAAVVARAQPPQW